MKAKDLIKILEQYPESEVVITSNNFEHHNAIISLDTTAVIFGKEEKRIFRDGFDNENYTKNVWRIYFVDQKKAKKDKLKSVIYLS